MKQKHFDIITIFLRSSVLELSSVHEEKDFYWKIKDNMFVTMLAYLADFFAEINNFNNALQGTMTNILTAQYRVASFRTLWKQRCIDVPTIFWAEQREFFI